MQAGRFGLRLFVTCRDSQNSQNMILEASKLGEQIVTGEPSFVEFLA